MDLNSDRPVWAILAPLEEAALRSAAERILRERYRPAAEHEPAWEVVGGSRGMSALVSYELGSEGTDAGIAETLSAAIPGRVVVLRFEEDREAVWWFEGGQQAGTAAGEPAAVAAEHGVEIPGLAVEEPAPHVQNPSLCLVPGHAPGEVARILGFDGPPSGGPLHVEPVAGGTAVRSDAGSAAIFLRDLSRGTGGRVYCLATHDGGSAFSCLVVEDGEDVGLYQYPERAAAAAPALEDVAGETEPARILTALGVPPALLGLTEPG